MLGCKRVWIFEQLHVGICELQTNDQQIQVPKECPTEEPQGGDYQQGLGEARFPPCGTCYRLLIHAGGRDVHRSSR